MYELDFITDMVEEQIVKGGLRWLANFNEVRRDFTIGDISFPVYASGGLEEKGFFLSRIFSAMVTPKYKIHLLIYASPVIDPKFVRKIIISCKSRFATDDWIFLGLVQTQPLEKTFRDTIAGIGDKTVGVGAYSLTSKETISSNNVLGKGLVRQLKLTESKFDTFDVPNYLKSFAIMFGLGMSFLIFIALSGLRVALHPFTIMLMVVFSIIAGYPVYKSRYHTVLSLNSKGFQLREGKKVTEGKWSDYSDATIHITSRNETFIRLYSKKETFDLPVTRVGISRKELYNAVKQLLKRKQNVTQ